MPVDRPRSGWPPRDRRDVAGELRGHGDRQRREFVDTGADPGARGRRRCRPPASCAHTCGTACCVGSRDVGATARSPGFRSPIGWEISSLARSSGEPIGRTSRLVAELTEEPLHDWRRWCLGSEFRRKIPIGEPGLHHPDVPLRVPGKPAVTESGREPRDRVRHEECLRRVGCPEARGAGTHGGLPRCVTATRAICVVHTPGQHDTGTLGDSMGPASGVVLRARDEPIVYVAGGAPVRFLLADFPFVQTQVLWPLMSHPGFVGGSGLPWLS